LYIIANSTPVTADSPTTEIVIEDTIVTED
jgi:hypothetical protein